MIFFIKATLFHGGGSVKGCLTAVVVEGMGLTFIVQMMLLPYTSLIHLKNVTNWADSIA